MVVAYATYSIEIEDKLPQSRRMLVPVQFDAAPTFGEVQQTADDIFDILDPIIDGRIASCSVTYELSVDVEYTGKTVPANIDGEIGANFSWRQNNGRAETMYIPTLKESMMPGGQVNQADTAVATFITEMLTGLGGDTGSLYFGFQQSGIASLAAAYRTKRK